MNIKTILVFTMCLLTILMATIAQASTATILARWAWNGTNDSLEGFRFYLNDSIVSEIEDPDARETTWDMQMEDGTHTFHMVAYGSDWESLPSPGYRFEYINIDVDQNRAPSVFISIQ